MCPIKHTSLLKMFRLYDAVVFRHGLYISDIPLHDATRDLVLMSEQFEADYKLTRDLELLTDNLQQTYRELEGEKEKTDRLLAFFIDRKFNYCQ